MDDSFLEFNGAALTRILEHMAENNSERMSVSFGLLLLYKFINPLTGRLLQVWQIIHKTVLEHDSDVATCMCPLIHCV